MNTYRIDYSNEDLDLDNEFDIIWAESDDEARQIALSNKKYDVIWDIVLVDEEYNEIKSIW